MLQKWIEKVREAITAPCRLVTGVGSGLGILSVNLGKSSPPLCVDFYVLSQFALLCDGMIGLPSLESHGILIDKEQRLIHYAGRKRHSMDVPTHIASPWQTKTQPLSLLTAAPVQLATPQPLDVLPRWDSVNAVVLIDKHVAKCVKCAQHKGISSRPAHILEYPPPNRPWDVVSIDLLQLPTSAQGSKYLLVMVDMFFFFFQEMSY